MILYDFNCEECEYTFEYLGFHDDVVECPKCRSICNPVISTPTIKLEGISGDFPTAHSLWAKKHTEAARIANKRNS